MTHHLTRAFLWVVGAAVGLFMLIPMLIVVPLSFNGKASFAFPPSGWSLQWYEQFFTDPEWTSSLANSLLIASLVTVVSVAIGTSAALGLRRLSPRIGGPLRAVMLTPLIIPGVILAVGIYTMYLYGQLVGTLTGFIAAHTLFAVPYVVLSVGTSLSVFDERLNDASSSLGAGPFTSFALVTFPSILPGIAAGALIAFITSFDEVIVALFIQSPLLKTLPVQMYSSLTRDTNPTMAAASTVILTVTSLAVLLTLAYSTRRKKTKEIR